jgi:hypothetical protein
MSAAAGTAAGRKSLVMVADPDPRSLKDISAVLADSGVEVLHVRSSIDIEEHAKDNLPALLVLCVDDPIWRDVTRTVRSSARLRSIPLLLCSEGPAASELILHWFEEEGGWAYARKPLDSDFVLGRLAQLFPEALGGRVAAARDDELLSQDPGGGAEPVAEPAPPVAEPAPPVALDVGGEEETGTLEAIESIEDDLQFALQHIDGLERELAQMEAIRRERDALIVEVAQSGDVDALSAEDVTILQARVDELQGELDSSQAKVLQQAEQIESAVGRSHHLEGDQRQLQSQLAESTVMLEALREEGVRREEDHEESLDLLRGHLQGVSDDRDSLRQERATAQETLEQHLAEAEATVAALREESQKVLDEAQARYASLEAEKDAEALARYSSLEAEKDAEAGARIEASARIEALEAQQQAAVEEAEQRHSELIAAQEQAVAEVEQRFHDLEASKAAELQDAEARCRDSEEEKRRALAESDVRAHDLEEQSVRIRLEADAHIERTEEDRREAAAAADELRAQLQRLRTDTGAELAALREAMEDERERQKAEAEQRLMALATKSKAALEAAQLREQTLEEQSLRSILKTDGLIADLAQERRTSEAAEQESIRLCKDVEQAGSRLSEQTKALDDTLRRCSDLEQESTNLRRDLAGRNEEFEEDEEMRRWENQLLREELDTLRGELESLRTGSAATEQENDS